LWSETEMEDPQEDLLVVQCCCVYYLGALFGGFPSSMEREIRVCPVLSELSFQHVFVCVLLILELL